MRFRYTSKNLSIEEINALLSLIENALERHAGNEGFGEYEELLKIKELSFRISELAANIAVAVLR